MWNWIKRQFGNGVPKPSIAAPVPDPRCMERVRWLEADDVRNPFGVRVLDCLSTAMGLLSVTSDLAVANRSGALRQSDGREHVGRLPADAVQAACDLRYPTDGPVTDGAVYRAGEMEDKWDIYLYEGRLYFTRSWTGNLGACADVRIDNGEAHVTRVYVSPLSGAAADDPDYAVRFVDFLIKSHLCGWRVPHPLPAGVPPDPQAIAVLSFGLFGRRGFAATLADTLPFRQLPPGSGAASDRR